MFSNTDKFAEDFSDLTIYSIIDLYSEYNQIPFDSIYRDITAIQTVKELLRMTTILQKKINSVGQYQYIVQFVLYSIYKKYIRAFLDDFGVKRPKMRYNNKLAFPGIKQFVLEYIQNFNNVLYFFELAEIVILAEKSQFDISDMAVVE